MKFFHVYNENCFEGLVKNNLINRDSGFKIQNVFSVPKERKFNQIAAKGGKLYEMIKKERYPFYADRIAGGVIYCKYEYDAELLRTYKELLGDWFLGVQLHESASNRRVDWNRILKRMEGDHGPYDVDLLRERSKAPAQKTDNGKPLYSFIQDPPEEFAKMRYADNMAAYEPEVEDMFKRRMQEVGGMILPCDSYILASRMQDRLGINSFMPEVGSQIPMMRIAVSLVRATAKASKKTWGVYYECWRADQKDGKISYCMPCFNLDPINEWYLTQENHGDDFTTHGKNGGSSRLLQNRIYYYALMSGADYFSEEWGLNCSYDDMQDFTLSEYGMTKKRFIDTALQLRGIKAVTPIAIVIPKEHEFIFLPEPYVDYTDGKLETMSSFYNLRAKDKKISGHVEDVLRFIYDRTNPVGNEGHVITNSRFGDVFDIIYSDADDAVLAQYDCLIDASADGTFKHEKQNSKLRILESNDFERLEKELQTVIREVMPCSADGLCWLVSTDENGKRYLSVFNNEGNTRSTENGDVVDHSCDATVKLSLKTAAEFNILPCSAEGVRLQKSGETYSLTVPATGFAILEF